MEFDIRKQRIPIWWIAIAIFILAAFITLFSNSSTPLEGYNGNTLTDKTDSGEIDEKLDETFFVYKVGETGFSMEIPDNWKSVVKDGGQSFIHAESSTSIRFKSYSYDPGINFCTNDYLLQKYLGVNPNAEVISRSNLDSSSSCIIYCEKIGDILYDHIGYFFWDRNVLVMADIMLKDSDYNNLKALLDHMGKSIYFEPNEPISKELGVFYNQNAEYEIAIPLTWNYSLSEGSLYAIDSNTGTSLTVYATPSSVSLADFDQVDYNKFASQGRSDFILSSFSSGSNYVYAEFTYINQTTGTKMAVIQELIATGTYEYVLTYEVPFASVNNVYSTIKECLSYFRYFY